MIFELFQGKTLFSYGKQVVLRQFELGRMGHFRGTSRDDLLVPSC